MATPAGRPLFILLGVIPGAVVADRIGYIVIHLDYYGAHPQYWFDPARAPSNWASPRGRRHAGRGRGRPRARCAGRSVAARPAVPVLLGLASGKLAMALGGDGQGIPSDLSWATAYTGQGPWGSLAPAVPSHPAQVYEGLLTLLVAVLIAGLLLIGRSRHLDGRLFYAGLSLWALARLGAAFVWRDFEALGPFSAAQIVSVLIALTGIGLFVWLATGSRRGVKRVRC